MYKLNRELIATTLLDFTLALFCFSIIALQSSLLVWSMVILASFIWVTISFLTGRLHFSSYKKRRYAFIGIAGVGSLSAYVGYLLYSLSNRFDQPSRSILYATGAIVIVEYLLYLTIRSIALKKNPTIYAKPKIENIEEKKVVNNNVNRDLDSDIKSVIESLNKPNAEFNIIDLLRTNKPTEKSLFLESIDPEAILKEKQKSPNWVIVTERLNSVSKCNTFLSYINYSLEDNGYIVCHCETTSAREERIIKETPPGINKIILFCDYIVNRVVPKLTLTRGIYSKITKGKKRAISRVEILGRIYRAGFEVMYEKSLGSKLYIIARKKEHPIRDEKPNTGVLIKLRRVGKGGKVFGVYKFRTMYAYSEYLQDYIYNQSGLSKGGKIENDYRVSKIGRLLRKTWLDEIPMILNFIKGDIKLVGVRPLSNHYFNLYSKELQDLRIKVKPGLLPPFYADMPETLEEIQDSESRYLNAYISNPIATDIKYLLLIVNNIVLKGKRSK